MKRLLLLLCILVIATVSVHELCLDAAVLQQMDLSELTVLSDEEYRTLLRRRLPWMTDMLTLSVDGQDLPQDETGLYYAPTEQGVQITCPKNACLARTEFQTDAQGNTTCTILRSDGLSRSSVKLLITGLPVMDLQLIDPKSESVPIGDSGRELGLVRLFSADAQDHLAVRTEAVTARVRGASSRQYEKKSYTLAFVDESGAARTASLLDLPPDMEYGLNSLFEDESKIRDTLAFQIWANLDASTHSANAPVNAVSMEHVELLINGTYWGIYGLQQLITPAALSMTAEDALFKINGEFVRYKDVLYAMAGEIVHPLSDPDRGAILLQEAFETIPNIRDVAVPTLQWDNAINYALLVQLTCAVDNETRNMAACYRAKDNAVYMIGWDLDQTFGSCWNGIAPALVGNDLGLAETDRLAMHEWKEKPFSTLFNQCDGFSDALIARYHALRKTIFSEDALLSDANTMFDRLTDCGARARDAARWPTSPVSTENFVAAFLSRRIAYLDTLYASAKPDSN